MKNYNGKTKYDFKKLFFNIFLTVLIVAFVFLGLEIWESQKKYKQIKVEFTDVNRICELATLRCYYHDVAEYEKQPDGLFKYGLLRYGYKKFFVEYDGIVEVGIDASKVQVNEPDVNGEIKIFVPKAIILDLDADKKSINEKITDTGIFTKITTDEKAEVFAEAQKTMKRNAENDSVILTQAYNNAKELLKRYVVSVGEQMGRQYTVKWINEPIDNATQEE